MATSRRLAAILAADVAGYSRLMGADEEGTLERLKALRRELLDPKIAEHKGRIVKTTGDGLLVEFAERRRCGALRGRGAAGDARAEHRHRGGQPHRIAHRRQPRRRDRRGRRSLWRRRQHRGAHRSLGRCRRGVRLQYGSRPRSRPAALCLRGSGRAAGQEHRPAGAGLPRRAARPAPATLARERGTGSGRDGRGLRQHCHSPTSRRSRCCRLPI